MNKEDLTHQMYLDYTISVLENQSNHISDEHFDAWILFLQQNRVLALTYHYAKSNSALPPEQAERLKHVAEQSQRKNLLLASHQIALHRAFQKANMPYFSLKGLTLSMRLYGDFTLRQSRDIDILIQSEQLELAHALLLGLGYRRQTIPSSYDFLNEKEYKYYHPAHRILLELHVRLFSNRALFPLKLINFKSPQFIELQGENIPVLPNALEYTYLWTHAAIHNWARMLWLSDLVAFWSQMTSQEQAEAKLLMRELDVRTSLGDFEANNWSFVSRLKPEHYTGIKRMWFLWQFNHSLSYKWYEIIRILTIPYRKWHKKKMTNHRKSKP